MDFLKKTWKQMHQRCYNPTADQYKWYGAKGIKVEASWHDFSVFAKDVGERPEGMTLDRKDNTKDYSKCNFRWATRREQANNRHNTTFIVFEGMRKSTYEWGRFLGVTNLKEFSRRAKTTRSFIRAACNLYVNTGPIR
jgi:hypothetical protein